MAVGKRMKAAKAAVPQNGSSVALTEAVKLVQQNAKAKFDETVEISIVLNVDTTQADQQVRGMMVLPHGTGKTVRVAVFAKGDKAEAAKKAGADIVGAEDLADAIARGEINFDRCIATPDMMGMVGKVGKILGPRGLMPNPKLGTVTPQVEVAVKAAKSGQIEFRAEKAGVVHAGIGKASFGEAKLLENARAFLSTVIKAKPSGVKGVYVKKVAMSSTMGPGVRVDLTSALESAAS